EQSQHDGPQRGEYRAEGEVTAGELRLARQAVYLRFVSQQVEGIEPAQHGFIGAVEGGPPLAQFMQLLHAAFGALVQFPDGAELDGISRAGFGAGRLHAALQPVVAQRALLRRIRYWVNVNDPERAGCDAIAAAIADIRLDDHGIELGADDGAGGA